MPKTIQYKYLVAEDERLIRKNLIKKIDSLNLPLINCGEVANGTEAIELIIQTCPHIVITDIRMPECDGLELAKYLSENHPGIKTMILSGYDDFSYAQAAIRYSVNDYLLKPVVLDDLYQSLQKLIISMNEEFENIESYDVRNQALNQTEIAELMIKYLKENFAQDISIQGLADKFGFTPEYLGKIFKKVTGETPQKYLTKLRMNEATRLLLSSPETEIQIIGELVGYKNAFYFSRAFKNYTGLQPSEFRILSAKTNS